MYIGNIFQQTIHCMCICILSLYKNREELYNYAVFILVQLLYFPYVALKIYWK